ncbi:MAG TPA: hypothetical protein VLH16_02860 [Bacteroidales bacterium]|nr:hypothetical protein [Bacteroidales bacterium]
MTGSQTSGSSPSGFRARKNNILARLLGNLITRHRRKPIEEEPLFVAPAKQTHIRRMRQSWFQRTFGRFFGAPRLQGERSSSYNILKQDFTPTQPRKVRSRKSGAMNRWIRGVTASKTTRKRSSDKTNLFEPGYTLISSPPPEKRHTRTPYFKRLFQPPRRKKRPTHSLIDSDFKITSPKSESHGSKNRFNIKRIFFPSVRPKKTKKTLLDQGFVPVSPERKIKKNPLRKLFHLNMLFPVRGRKKRSSYSLIEPHESITPPELKRQRKKARLNLKRIFFPTVKLKKTRKTLLDPDFVPVSHVSENNPGSKRIALLKFFRFTKRRKQSKNQSLLPQSFVAPNKQEAVPHEPIRVVKGFRLSLNSLFLYILALLVMYLFHQLLTLFIAFRFDIAGDLFHYGIRWPISADSQQWQPLSKLLMISFIAPVVSLITALTVNFFIHKLSKNPYKRLFWLWVTFHGYNLFFGAFAAGILTSQGFGHLSQWYNVSDIFRIFMAVSALFFFVLAGLRLSTTILEASPTPPHSAKRRSLVFYLMVVPVMFGTILMILIRLPYFPHYDNLMLITLLAGVIPLLFGSGQKIKHVPEYATDYGWKIKTRILIIALLSLFVYRFALSFGFNYGLLEFNLPVHVF